MDIIITIPDDKSNSIIEAFAIQYKYKDKIPDTDGKKIDNPISKEEFALNIIKSFIKDVYVASKVKEVDDQRSAVITTARAEANAITVTVK